MTRRVRVCTQPGCGKFRPCPTPGHEPAPWQGSTRKARLPPGWQRIRRQILKRDNGICHVCGKPGADEVDHITPGDNHHPTNLAAIHDNPCHRTKTAKEANDARNHR